MESPFNKDGLCHSEIPAVKPETSKPLEAQPFHPPGSTNCQAELTPRAGNGRVAAPPDYDSREDRKNREDRLEIPERISISFAVSSKGNWSQNLCKSLARPGIAVITALVSIAIITGVVYAYQTFQTKTKPAKDANAVIPAVVTVTAIAASKQSVEDTLSVTGSIWAWDPLSVGAEVSGLRITSVNVEEGDRVSRGQVLASLNSALLKAQLEQAQARLKSSEANLLKAIQPNRPEDIVALQAALAQAEANVHQEEAKHKQAGANLGNAQMISHRFTELAKAGAISTQDAENRQVEAVNAKEEVNNAEERIIAAQSTVDQARQKLLVATRGGRLEDVQISRATVAEIKAQVRHLQQQIEQTIIRAPDDGLIAKRDAHIGDITASGVPLFQMVRMNRLELRAQVSDIDIAKVHPGQSVKVTILEDGSQPIIARVRLVNPLVDNSTRLGIVRVDLPGDAGLKAGMFVRGEITIGKHDAVTVPSVSLVTRNSESVVFRLEPDNSVTSIPVIPGTRTAKFVEIKEGLAEGDLIVARGARFLQDRDLVRVSNSRGAK